ncbi:hypothetical protein [Nostoc sp. FACHB-190]|uniref:hypothetical protein n=1 Tax=Nostoc sp. FACHB-190 TaxID=2692838 RepID=UPI0016823A1B|nr:hypothetical protein [Nostoc sp. FACHB-190]MBD2297166.1 hypothetical protein [Nostoc sp. FACHB-190]
MSYVSLLKNIPEILSQPTGIAALASVGIHGAIALIVPLMPVDPSKPKDAASSKSVGILELSQADQNRLPQTPGTSQFAVQPQLPTLSQQQLALQPQALPPNFGGQTTVIPPLPPSGYTQSVIPSIPTTSNNYRISSMPGRQSIQFPRQSYGFDSRFKVGNQKFTAAIPNFDNKPVIPENSQPQLPDLPPAQIPPDILNSPTPNPAYSSSVTTANSKVTPQSVQPEPENNVATNPNPNSGTVINQTPKTGDNTTSTTNLPALKPINTPNLPTKAPNQTLIAQVQSYEELRKELQQKYPNSEEKPVIRDTVPVSKTGVEGTVLGVLVVDPDGKVLDIKFQDKLLSPALLLKTRQYFNAKSLKGEKTISRYPFNLRFQDGSNTAGDGSQQTPSATNQPATDSQPIILPAGNSSKLKPNPVVTSQPLTTPAGDNLQPKSSTSITNRNQLSSSQEPNPELIQKLRDVKEKRENSDSGK